MPSESEKKEKSLEEAFEELDGMIKELEDRETSLDKSFQVYNEGMKLLKYCNEKIDKVEKKIISINEAGEIHEF